MGRGALLVALSLGLGEGLARVLLPHGASYYAGREVGPGERAYAFGTIRLNREGFPDGEWSVGTLPRVGWLGDSVVYGIGAGGAHRFTEHLRRLDPHHAHLNLGQLGYPGPRQETLKNTVRLARSLHVGHLVYVLNLNDVEPQRPEVRPRPSSTRRWLRSRSLLFASLHDLGRNIESRRGGHVIHHFFPRRHAGVYARHVEQVQHLAAALSGEGVRLSVAVLPVEMQVSDAAATAYRARGLAWEEGFVEGSPQDLLVKALGTDLQVVDLRWAFLDPADPQGSRAEAPMCGGFVCDSGGAQDWNHLNREGHRAVAAALARSPILTPHGPRVAQEGAQAR